MWLLGLLGRSAGKEAQLLRGMKFLLETSQRTADSPEMISCDRAEFIAILTRVERDSHKRTSVRGASAGILWTLGAADEEQNLSDLMIFAAPGDLDLKKATAFFARESS